MNYIVRRIIISIAIIVVIVNLDFFLPRLVPGNAAEVMAGGFGQSSQIALLEQRLGLNQPLYIQYLDYIRGVFSWPPSFGFSFQYFPEPVTTLIQARLGWSLLLVFASLVLSLLIVYGMSLISSMRRGGKFEISALYASISFHSIPVYWLAMAFLWVFSVSLGIFPISGGVDPNVPFGLSYIISVVRHAVLPTVVLALSLLGQSYLVLRSATQEVLKSDYVMAAKSRGLRNRLIASRYIVRNSLLPLVSLLSFSLSGLISRVILVEIVFGYPGMGDLMVDAILNHDYPVLEGSFFVLTVLIVIGGLIGDVVLTRIDPRLRSLKVEQI